MRAELMVAEIPPEQVRQEAARAADLVDHAFAPNTRRAYVSSWRAFGVWCTARAIDRDASTPEIVATYLTSRLEQGLSVPAIVRAYSALASNLREIQPQGPWAAGLRPEIIRRLMKGAGREYGRPSPKKKPLLPEHFMQLADPARFDTTHWIESARNRALLLFGFAGGFRRSELVALDVSDLELSAEGARVLIRRSKTDQAGEGAQIGVHRQRGDMCPVGALETYLRGGRVAQGPVFRQIHKGRLTPKRLDDQAVARLVKAAVVSIGLDPAEYAGHSLRCGFVTAAAAAKADLDSIMNTTRHKSVEQVRGYIRRASPFDRNASKGLLEREGEDDDQA